MKKKTLAFYLMIFINIANAQNVVERDSHADTVSKHYILLPTFEINNDLLHFLESLVKDCQSVEHLKSDKSFFLFYSKRVDSSFRVIVHPFLSPIDFDSNCYGMFRVQGKAFICCGNNAKDLLKQQMTVDSFMFNLSPKTNLETNSSQEDKWDPDLYAPVQTICKKINGTLYNILIQPCSDGYLRRRRR